VLQYYDPSVPDGLTVDLKYTAYASTQYYFVVLKAAVVRESPKSGAKALKRVAYSNRLEMLAKVSGSDGKSTWYRVRFSAKSIGYIPASAGSPRSFQLDSALKRLKLLAQIADKPNTVRIHNYNNVHGLPPKISGKTADSFGTPRDQSAPAYLTPDTKSSFRYIPDGMLCELLGATGKFSEVYVPYWDEVRYVPSAYIYNKDAESKTPDVIKKLTQVVVVDRANQNIMTFENRGGKWVVLSMCFVSTGKKGGYYEPTPLGDFFTDKRPAGKLGIGEFWYMADGVDENNPNAKYEGYAPWAIRFTAGAYLHGLPVDVSYGADGKVIFTGRTYESASFLGVEPESHMCVRNYTSHAKFLYKWITDGNAAVIVIQ
jgi:lipoprotein-anchoring transpeptidase ErfK/SrfK